MNFRTEIQAEKLLHPIEHKHPLMFIGSCFAQNMGNAFAQAGFKCCVNPYGVVFNPVSVATSLRHIMENKTYTVDDLVFSNHQWFSWFHHGSFAHADANELLTMLNMQLEQTTLFLKKANYLVITFGTAWVFQHKNLETIVTNCHKVAGSEFVRYKLSVEEIVAEWKALLALLNQFNPNLQVVFTLSPVRHLADGAHGNQLSKASLLLAIDDLCATSGCRYFPAYELLLDDLRDYRFYDSDMVHPSSEAIEYIREKLFSAWLSPKTQQLANEVIRLRKAEAHRPLHSNTPEWIAFCENVQMKIEKLKNENPSICW